MDFGIARLLDPETAETDNQTVMTTRAMTPNYASPEQRRGERMTTASDVYSLGVVLYELLAGQKPGVRKDGEADLKKLDADLDNIVVKALRTEPERRYSSVGQFSEDIRRYLEGLPVIARKDTFAYRTSKFVGRHKIGLAVAASRRPSPPRRDHRRHHGKRIAPTSSASWPSGASNKCAGWPIP